VLLGTTIGDCLLGLPLVGRVVSRTQRRPLSGMVNEQGVSRLNLGRLEIRGMGRAEKCDGGFDVLNLLTLLCLSFCHVENN
jgi:hypothetical protein